jgi:hypothetical protein
VADDSSPLELKHHDILLLQGHARREYVELLGEHRFKGMNKNLDPGERLALSWLRATIVLLNSKGAFREDFLREYVEPLETPNSDPASMDEPDWEVEDVGKSKRRP